ncbi:MAG: hypothetical protein K8953_00670, partial [Proteobacteria bacterium]|nr:hypothetical protein [Pseudomonadota bacterium]
ITTLTLAETYRDSSALIANLGGDRANGVSLFAVNVATADPTADPTTRFYSGLLAETTLTPLVLTTRAAVATWKGRFAMLYNKTTDNAKKPFTHTLEDFAIDFYFDELGYRDVANTEIADDGGRRFASSVNVPHPDGTSNDVGFTIQGTFSASGLLRGRITEDDTAFYGDITGLIGANGVVASFASTASPGTFGPYVGGFVAVQEGTGGLTRSPPKPDYITWSRIAVGTLTELTPAHTGNFPPFKKPTYEYTTDPLIILPEISSGDADFFNFVVGGATELSRNIRGVGTISTASGHSQGGIFSATFGAEGDFADTRAGGHDSSIPITLTLGDTYLQGDKDFNLNGDVADGISFLIGEVDNDENSIKNRAYAGLLSGTDLGAPIDENVSAEWKGRFYHVQTQGLGVGQGFNSSTLSKTIDVTRTSDFRLKVDFAGRTITAEVRFSTNTANFPDNDPYYSLDIAGNFTASTGIVSGWIDFQVSPSLKPRYLLSGLIGAEGLVAVFGGGTDVGFSLFGGFVARPTDDITETT